MPRTMPPLASQFEARMLSCLDLASRVERARSRLSIGADRDLLHPDKVELVYELAYFRCFLAWEEFLEQSLIRYMAGYRSSNYLPVHVGGSPIGTLAAAGAALLGGRSYVLWHDPAKTMARSALYLVAGPHQTVVSSALVDLQRFADVRHRIAHAQEDAKSKFDVACTALIGGTVRGSRPGKLLRSSYAPTSGTYTGPRVSWLSAIGADLASLAHQIA
jgi:hypothetical protein